MTEATQKTSASDIIRVSHSELPLSCPREGTDPAALHPRVFISLKKAGDTGVCPYCGAEYILKD